MCTGAEIAVAAAVLGGGASYINNQRALSRQDAQNAASIRRQGVIQREADSKVSDTVRDLAQSTSADERQSSLDQYLMQLRQGRAAANQGFASNVSDAYDSAVSDAAAQANNYGATKANLFSRIDGPTNQRRMEGYAIGDLGTALTTLADRSSTEDYLNRLRLASIRPNPWVQLGSQALQGVSMAAAAGAFNPATSATGATGAYNGTFGSYQPITIPGFY